MNPDFAETTRRSSKTFFIATLFFPKKIRDDVFILYTFLRRADDMIDANPPQIREYNDYKKKAFKALEGDVVNDIGLLKFADVVKRHTIKNEEIDAFFISLELDLASNRYKTFHDLRQFTYGVAEVVGLMMAHVMDLPNESFESAKNMGLAMQLVNILRDIREDAERGKTFLPQEDLKKYGLPESITDKTVKEQSKQFNELMIYEIKRTKLILIKARTGFGYIPKRIRLAIQIAADIYERYLRVLEKNPAAQYSLNIRPSYYTIVMIAIKNYIALYVRH